MELGEHVTSVDARVRSARVVGQTLIVSLMDGREVRVPIAWFPRLAAGSPEDRARLRIIEDGRAINWPDLDEDIGVEPLMVTKGPSSALG
ncbi:MAG TPA: DUF2442 domain-containing protein [Candidatus Limnocylindrales bacterium]|jgi:hypothetical protein